MADFTSFYKKLMNSTPTIDKLEEFVSVNIQNASGSG